MASPKLARSLGGQIAKSLRDDVLTGRLAEGELLQENKLAVRFGVSRGPVRDALLELTKEGVLVSHRLRGVTVAGSAPQEIESFVVPLRRTIECYALALCFESLTKEDFSNWDEILEQMKRACVAQDHASIVEQDIALHRSFLERANQPDLLAIWTTIVARIRRYFIEGCRRYADPMEQYNEHIELINAFRSGDKERALAALTQHVEYKK
jgi:DNA-binding GntR family transcriptional regulator